MPTCLRGASFFETQCSVRQIGVNVLNLICVKCCCKALHSMHYDRLETDYCERFNMTVSSLCNTKHMLTRQAVNCAGTSAILRVLDALSENASQ